MQVGKEDTDMAAAPPVKEGRSQLSIYTGTTGRRGRKRPVDEGKKRGGH